MGDRSREDTGSVLARPRFNIAVSVLYHACCTVVLYIQEKEYNMQLLVRYNYRW